MLYEDQARKLAEAINGNWSALSRMMDDEREEALVSICHDILRFGSAGFTTPFTFTHIDIDAMIKKMLKPQLPPSPPPKERKNPPPRDPNKPYEPWELNQGDDDATQP